MCAWTSWGVCARGLAVVGGCGLAVVGGCGLAGVGVWTSVSRCGYI